MSKKDIVPAVLGGGAGAVGGAGIGGAIGNAIEPLKTKLTADMSWGMSNADGTVSHPMVTHVLNQAAHDAAVQSSTATGAAILGLAGIATGIYLGRKNRNLGRQFD